MPKSACAEADRCTSTTERCDRGWPTQASCRRGWLNPALVLNDHGARALSTCVDVPGTMVRSLLGSQQLWSEARGVDGALVAAARRLIGLSPRSAPPRRCRRSSAACRQAGRRQRHCSRAAPAACAPALPSTFQMRTRRRAAGARARRRAEVGPVTVLACPRSRACGPTRRPRYLASQTRGRQQIRTRSVLHRTTVVVSPQHARRAVTGGRRLCPGSRPPRWRRRSHRHGVNQGAGSARQETGSSQPHQRRVSIPVVLFDSHPQLGARFEDLPRPALSAPSRNASARCSCASTSRASAASRYQSASRFCTRAGPPRRGPR